MRSTRWLSSARSAITEIRHVAGWDLEDQQEVTRRRLEVAAEYGPDRILLETDSAGVLRSDVFAVKRTILEVYRMGIDVDAIRQVVFENPRRLRSRYGRRRRVSPTGITEGTARFSSR
ncbi:hypothetical protein [Halalkalicoccus ordinarius]|uniref:hypothetical protein n=1 Tax=Halalkalicoccus ordinarius TaxID=3116651 RepID=UPI00300EC42F